MTDPISSAVHRINSGRAISQDIDALIARLARRERELTFQLDAMASELSKTKSALSLLRNLRGAEMNSNRGMPPINTREVVRRYLETVQPGTVITAAALLTFVETVNWNTNALDRHGAFATVLVRMAELGELTKTGHGVYRKPGV